MRRAMNKPVGCVSNKNCRGTPSGLSETFAAPTLREDQTQSLLRQAPDPQRLGALAAATADWAKTYF
jgi:hypothetical protein